MMPIAATETGDSRIIRFETSLPPKGLRTNSKTRSTGYRAALTRQYAEAVWCEGNVAMYSAPWPSMPPWEKAHVHYVWYSTHETDVDNIIGSMKAGLDVLKSTGARPLSIIADDGPGVTVTAEWRRERERSKGRVEITITEVSDDVYV